MMFSNVDLPEPEDPMIETNSPSSILSETPFRTCSELFPVLYDL
jgi:hypothetical protein